MAIPYVKRIDHKVGKRNDSDTLIRPLQWPNADSISRIPDILRMADPEPSRADFPDFFDRLGNW
jgi:hypothetical protein